MRMTTTRPLWTRVSYQWKILSVAPMDERMKKLLLLFALMLTSGLATAQPPLRLRGLNPSAESSAAQRTRTPGRSHWLVQFMRNPSRAELEKLKERGAWVLSYVPDSAFSISISDGVSFQGLNLRWAHRLQPSEKISSELDKQFARDGPASALVEFYKDVDPNDAHTIVNEAGLRVVANPDLLPNHLLVRGSRRQMLALADWDEVSYVFPASKDLTEGRPVFACAGAMTSEGTVSQAIPLIGDGWDGPGLGSASL